MRATIINQLCLALLPKNSPINPHGDLHVAVKNAVLEQYVFVPGFGHATSCTVPTEFNTSMHLRSEFVDQIVQVADEIEQSCIESDIDPRNGAWVSISISKKLMPRAPHGKMHLIVLYYPN